jgi:glycosyltransferase involved in cell wall biosynthesis
LLRLRREPAVDVSSVTVLICTFNRCAPLARTLDYFVKLPKPPDYSVDVIVVDNNSSDATPEVVGAAAAAACVPIRYVREGRQGKSFALNTGLALACGDILALTDDDVILDADWLDRIVDVFRTTDVVFVGGKVLPLWEAPPPSSLLTKRAQDIWGPLGLLDYGEERIFYDGSPHARRRPLGGNLAIRRDAIVEIGGWRTDLGRPSGTLISGEDHEIYFRLQRAGRFRGVYEPAMVVHHAVLASKMTPTYFRRWFFAAGQTRALMARDFFPDIDFRRVPRIAGVPRFLYRELARLIARWIQSWRLSRLDRWIEQLMVVRHAGLMWGFRLDKR